MPLAAFHPTVRSWFADRLGEPTPPQERGWPVIRSGRHTLIAAPTGSGKTLAAFLSAVDALLCAGEELADETRVLYVSPLRALSNDVRRNLEIPLRELRERDPSLPELRVMVRTGDTTQSERASMTRKPPHILVTTPESLYILLTSQGGRRMLETVRTVIVDEIHAILGDKRGSHLALSLERLEALAGPVQRIGLSATQKPVEEVGNFLVGAGRDCAVLDEGFLRQMDVAVEIPESPLSAVCSHETWAEIYGRMTELIREHRTTLLFVGTRKLAERVAAELSKLLGEEEVACHHSSMSKERRFDAEQRLKAGELRALVATASLELGIDIGDVDLVIQIGATRSIATFLQRVGRAGHSLSRVPKGRLFPLTQDELVEAAALLRAARLRVLDRTPQPAAPLDILAQQVVAACVAEDWKEEQLFQTLRRAWPYRGLERAHFDQAVALHTEGRHALLHRDGVQGRLLATRRARLPAITGGGAIPDNADYQVIQEPDGTYVGTLNEDFAIESSRGDIFQLGNTAWRILQVQGGVVRVADAHGQPPTVPFWLGEGPSRTAELSAEIGAVREHGVDPAWLEQECDLPPEVARALAEYLEEGRRSLGATPTQSRVILERFFDESGGMQLVLHAPFGGRINRAWGLALRKRFCRAFGFELQAAANEEAIVLSLGPQHSFPLEEVFDYLSPATARDALIQAILPLPMFSVRWRWNVTRSLVVERWRGGKRVPPPLLRMRADDQLVKAFPQVVACGETLPPGDLPVPDEHPLVRQTVEDCLHEAMDVDGFLSVLEELRAGRIETRAVDNAAPSAFARGILASQNYTFLDDAPLEERRTQAVHARRFLDAETADELGALDEGAVARVRDEAWPDPRDAEEVHEALLWMGFVRAAEAEPWRAWLDELAACGRVMHDGDAWFAAEASREPVELLRGRLQALGPVFEDDAEVRGLHGQLATLEQEGFVLRCRLDGRQAWCERRLLARIFRYTLEQLRSEIEPVSATEFLRFLRCWQHLDEDFRLEGPAGVAEVLRQLAGFEAPVAAWERKILSARVREYQPEWLDLLTLRGDLVWGRLWGSGGAPVRATPVAFFPREELEAWTGLAGPASAEGVSWRGKTIEEALEARGATFVQDLARLCGPLSTDLEQGLRELVGRGRVSSDSYAALRHLVLPAWKKNKKRHRHPPSGRWSLLRPAADEVTEQDGDPVEKQVERAEFLAGVLLRRWGVVFRRMLEKERLPVPWRDLVRTCRRLELRGEIRGGRFVAGFSGEQFALPEAVELLRKLRRQGERAPLAISAADPLNLQGILTPEERVPVSSRRKLLIEEQQTGS